MPRARPAAEIDPSRPIASGRSALPGPSAMSRPRAILQRARAFHAPPSATVPRVFLMYFIGYNASLPWRPVYLLSGGARAIFVERCGDAAHDLHDGVSRMVLRRGAPAGRGQPLRGREPARCPSGFVPALRIGARSPGRLLHGGLERSGAEAH